MTKEEAWKLAGSAELASLIRDPMVDVTLPGFKLSYKGAQVWPPEPVDDLQAVEAYPSPQHEAKRREERSNRDKRPGRKRRSSPS